MLLDIGIQDLCWLLLISVIVLLCLFVFSRTQYILLKKDILKRKSVAKLRFKVAQDLSDDLSNGFNNIRIMAKECNINQLGESELTITNIEKLCDDNIELMEDVLWATKYTECTAEDLVFKFEDYADDMVRSKNIPVEFINDGLVMSYRLGFFRRRNFLLVFKEGIKNLDFSFTSKVEITLFYRSGRFEMWIKNIYSKKLDSFHFDKSKYTRMLQLCEAIGGKLEIRESNEAFEVGLIYLRKIED